MADALLAVAKAYNWDAKKDKAGNVIITKEATKGKESCKTVCLQAHLDIVNQSERDDYNPLTDGVIPYIEGNFIRSKKTSLGADDGIGMK
jgi:dipeptidase D